MFKSISCSSAACNNNSSSSSFGNFQFIMNFLFILLVFYYFKPLTVSAALIFDPTALLEEILIPADAAVGSVIFRLRVSDTTFDYPLRFSLKETSTVEIETLNCTRFNSVCQANLILKKKLEPGRFYDFKLEAENQKGQFIMKNCSFQATNATTPIEKIFPGAPTLLRVSEHSHRNFELGSLIAKGNPNRTKAVYMELYGSVNNFGMHQKLLTDKDAEGTIILLNPLDYETQSVHHLTILANDPWTRINEDTRNIAGWPLLVAVIDEQDTPPIFTIAPPTTTLSASLQSGDKILIVHAEDGDRGQPRPIRYSLDSSILSDFFHISEKTGELTLARPISEIISYLSQQGQPTILLNVTAEEVRSNSQEPPSQSTTIQLALIPPGITLGSPTFGAIEYHALLNENAPVGTILDIPQAEVSTEPGDIVTLKLDKNNGTFDISPSVVEGFSKFTISVHDNRLLDYESRHYVECFIVAKELRKTGNYSARAKLTVILNDINDNPPEFINNEFRGSVSEHANFGTTVLKVEAVDLDRSSSSSSAANKIRYFQLSGPGSEFFNLNSETGVITVTNPQGLDAEQNSVINLEVFAADQNGEGLHASAKVKISVFDINDNAPKFDKDIYEFILNTDRISFTTQQAFVKAYDNDISAPNNEVHYQLLIPPINNDDGALFINEKTGEILLKKSWEQDELVIVKVRAYDEGIPRLSNDCEVRIYPPESKSRKMIFIVPGKYPEQESIEKTLSVLTGGKVVVEEIKPFRAGFEPSGATYVTRDKNGEKSVVIATIHYTRDSVVDVNRIQQIFDDNNNQQQIATNSQNHDEEENHHQIERSSTSGNLLWLLILLIVLAVLTAIILILCCICSACPLYIPPKRKIRTKSADIIEKLVIKGSGQGRESKSVQVAEWFGRKEAWSAEKVEIIPTIIGIDAETEADESLRRHEIDRGSDRATNFKKQQNLQQQQSHSISMQHLNQQTTTSHQQHHHQENLREQFYVREGNTDILRLITRAGGGGDPPIQRNNNNGATFTEPHQFIIDDNGKDILMRRFIDQQQAETANRAHHHHHQQILLPNAVNKLQSEQEFLEASLRQQNALLRQLILEKEKDTRLETQSLPAGAYIMSIGTQTDQDMSTQTDPQYLRPPRRKVQSEWELSDEGSDEEIAVIKARAKRRHRVNMKPRKIRTPILEESEAEFIMEKYRESPLLYNNSEKISLEKKNRLQENKPQFKHTRTSELRQQKMKSAQIRADSSSSKSALKREILREISASLNQTDDDDDDDQEDQVQTDHSFYSDDSLNDDGITSRSERTRGKIRSYSSSELNRKSRKKHAKSPKIYQHHQSTDSSDLQRFKSDSDLPFKRKRSSADAEIKTKSQENLNHQDKNKKAKTNNKRTSRYMEWYTKNKEKSAADKTDKPSLSEMDKNLKIESRLFKDTVSSSNKKKVESKKPSSLGPEHPLIQHSAYRYEIQYPKKQRRTEEDGNDSGIIVMVNKPEMAQKKSVFTIAYNDIHTKQLRPDSSVNTP